MSMRWISAAAALAMTLAASLPAGAQHGRHHGHRNQCLVCRPGEQPRPDLFANYYVPGVCGAHSGQMYLAPQPIPPVVGHTYITYQPFMPHELMYQHHRAYYRYYNGGRGMTRASVHWYRPPLISTLGGVARHFRIPR